MADGVQVIGLTALRSDMLDFGSGIVPNIASAALNRGAKGMRTLVKDDLHAAKDLPKGIVLKRLLITPAKASQPSPTAVLFAGLSPALIFPLPGARLSGKGVLRYRSFSNDRVFKAQMPSGHIGYFKRREKVSGGGLVKRLRIDEQQISLQPEANKIIEDRLPDGTDLVLKEYERLLDVRLQKLRK